MTNRRVDSANQNVGSVAKMTLFEHGAHFFVAIIIEFDVTFSL